MSTAIKYARGTVWWCEDNEFLRTPGVQSGRRPVVIVSSDQRGSCSSVEVVKMTLTDKSDVCTSINIPVNQGDRTSYVLCNQHFTVNTQFLGDYMYTLSDEAMKRIDLGLLRAQGMEDLAKIKETIDKINVRDLVIKKIQENEINDMEVVKNDE